MAEALNALLEKVRNETDVSQYAVGHVVHLAEDTLCEGCKGANADCAAGIEVCDDCYRCGCPACEEGKEIDYTDEWHPSDDYAERVEEYKPYSSLADAIRESKLGIVGWAPVLDKEFIMRHFSWESNKEIWQAYVLDIDNPIKCPHGVKYDSLTEEEQLYFIKPPVPVPAPTPTPSSETRVHPGYYYNLLRIMAGMPGLAFSN